MNQINETEAANASKDTDTLTEQNGDGQDVLNSSTFLTKKSQASQPVCFSDSSASRTRTPILIDNLSFTYRVVAGEDLTNAPFSCRRFNGPIEYASYFACPYIYPTKKTRPLLKLFGKHNARTNGVRVFRAAINDPIAHRGGHEKSIDQFENSNQLSDDHLNHLRGLANKANCSPSNWLLKEAYFAVSQAHRQVIGEAGLDHLNPPSEIQRHVKTDRLEVYFEVFNGYDLDELASVMEGVLKRYIKQPKQKRRGVQSTHDLEDRDAFLAWLIPADKIHPSFKRGKEFKFKVYRKNDRLRVELQANYPQLVTPTDRSQVQDPYIALAQDAEKISDVLASVLNFVWEQTLASLTSFDSKYQLYDSVLSRIQSLLPVKGRHPSARTIAEHISDNGFITLDDLRRFGWSRNDLRAMADKTYGFLAVRDVGFCAMVPGTHKPKKRIIGGIYDLNVNSLARSGRPLASGNVPPREIQFSGPVDALAQALSDASGSSLRTGDSAFKIVGKATSYSPA